MKTILCLLAAVAFIRASAQSLLQQGAVFRGPHDGETPQQERARIATETGQYNLRSIQNHWVRVVDGRTNFLRSATNWVTIPEFMPDNLGLASHYLKVSTVIKTGVVIDERSDRATVSKTFLLKNWPGEAKATTGDLIDPIRATRTGRYNYLGDTIPIYDYGIPITITNAPKTNAVATK